MWVLSKIADAFDQIRKENEDWLDNELQQWFDTTVYEEHSTIRNIGVWVTSGAAYSLNKFSTTVASGFLDVLRLGDGVKEGGWGYGKDALRLLMVLGPAARAARFATSLVTAVDISEGIASDCAWVNAARLLRFTGTLPLAQLGDVAKAAGIAAADAGAVEKLESLVPALNSLGADARTVSGDVKTLTDLAKVVKNAPDSAYMFAVEWNDRAHALIAYRTIFGNVRIIDRTGKLFSELSEVEDFPNPFSSKAIQKMIGYKGIGQAKLYGVPIAVKNTTVVKSLSVIPQMADIVRIPMMSINHSDLMPIRTERSDAGPSQ